MDSAALIGKLKSSGKYADICPETIARIVNELNGRYRKDREFEKAVRERLHGISSAFMTADIQRQLSGYIAQLKAGAGDEALTKALACHVSSRERLPLAATDAAYREIFAHTGTPKRVLDLACGLNPIYLACRLPESEIVGLDLSRSCIDAVSGFTDRIDGRWADLLDEKALPEGHFDIALAFKLLPLLERQRSGASETLMARISASALVVSFPTRTLSGRGVGMESHYSDWMEAHVPGGRTIQHRFTTDNELFYILA